MRITYEPNVRPEDSLTLALTGSLVQLDGQSRRDSFWSAELKRVGLANLPSGAFRRVAQERRCSCEREVHFNVEQCAASQGRRICSEEREKSDGDGGGGGGSDGGRGSSLFSDKRRSV